MSEQGAQLDPANAGKTARVIHAAIMGGLVLLFAVFMYLGAPSGSGSGAEMAGAFRIAGYGLLVAGVVVSGLLRGRVVPRRREEDSGAWWTANLGRAVPAWALAEGGGLCAIVMGWLIGDTTLMALGAAVSLALLFVSRPSRLESET